MAPTDIMVAGILCQCDVRSKGSNDWTRKTCKGGGFIVFVV